MSFANPPRFFSHPATAAAAFLLLVGASVWMHVRDPKGPIGERFERKYCCKEIHSDDRKCCTENSSAKGCCKKNPYFLTDSAFGFLPGKLYAMLKEYEPGDFPHHRQFIRDDFIYPFAYAISFAILILWLQAALSPDQTNRVWWLYLIPLAAGLFDLGENSGMWFILSSLEDDRSNKPDGLAYFTAAMNVLKWLMVCASVALILSGAVGLVLRKAYRFKP